MYSLFRKFAIYKIVFVCKKFQDSIEPVVELKDIHPEHVAHVKG